MAYVRKTWVIDDVVKPEDINRWEAGIEESSNYTRIQVESTGDSRTINITIANTPLVAGLTLSFKPPVIMDSNTTAPNIVVNGNSAPLRAADSDTQIVGSARLVLLPTRWYDIQYNGTSWVLQAVQSMTKISQLSDAATKLQTPRQLAVDLAKDTVTTFDGTANVAIPVTGVLPVAKGGSGNSTGLTFEYDQLATSQVSGTTLIVTSRTPKPAATTTYAVTFIAAAAGASITGLVIDGTTITAWRNSLGEDIYIDRADLFAAGAAVTVVKSGAAAFFKVGGGSSALRIRVIGGTSRPLSPREGDIWVNTLQPITSWGFDIDTSHADAWPEGSVLIMHNAASSGAQIQALKGSRRFIWLYPTGAKQKRGGVWYDVDMAYFQDGQWRTPRLWIFNQGNTYPDTTGGYKFWAEYVTGNEGVSDEYIGRVNGNRIQLQGRSYGSYWRSWVQTINTLNVSGFNSMKIRYQWSGTFGQFQMFCGTAVLQYGQEWLVRNPAGIMTLNISNVGGNVNPRMNYYMASLFEIYEWWLE